MVYTATARWHFRGEAWLSVEIEATTIESAAAEFYAMLPITFFRGTKRLVSLQPQNSSWFQPKLLGQTVSALATDEPKTAFAGDPDACNDRARTA